MVFHKEVGAFCFPRHWLPAKTLVSVGICLILLELYAIPARGQIAFYLDEHGKRVFVNQEEPARRRVSSQRRAANQSLRTTITQPGASPILGMSQRFPKQGLERVVQETAQRHRIDPALVRAVVEAESNWNPFAVSRKGALGLMQLVPGTAERFGVADAFDPEQNIDAGVRYLRALLERYHGDLHKSLAAYNAGERAVDQAGGVPHIAETRHYVQRITDSYFRPGSARLPDWWNASRPIYRAIDERGRVIFTNE